MMRVGPLGVSVWIGGILAVTATVTVMAANEARGAEPMFVALDYEASAAVHGCPGIDDVRQMVAGRLGYQPFRPDAARRVAIQVNPTRDRLTGRMEWLEAGRPPVERRFVARPGDCAELVRTIAFALAVQLQLLAGTEPPAGVHQTAQNPPQSPALAGPEQDRTTARGNDSPRAAAAAAPQAPAPSAGQPPLTPVAPPPPAAERRAVVSPPARARRLLLAVGGGPSVARGVTPETAFGLRLFGQAHSGRAAVEMDLEGTLPATTAAPDGTAFSHYRLGAMVVGCYQPSALAGCLIGNAARVTVRGSGVDAPHSGSGLAFDVGLRATASAAAGPRLFIRGRAELLVALTTLTVMLNDAPVWTRPRTAASVGVDVGFHLE